MQYSANKTLLLYSVIAFNYAAPVAPTDRKATRPPPPHICARGHVTQHVMMAADRKATRPPPHICARGHVTQHVVMAKVHYYQFRDTL